MSWDQQPTMNQDQMISKVQAVITEILESHRQVTVSGLGEFNNDILNHWSEELVKLGFKILRNAKAVSLLADQHKVERRHIDIAFNQVIKNHFNKNNSY